MKNVRILNFLRANIPHEIKLYLFSICLRILIGGFIKQIIANRHGGETFAWKSLLGTNKQ